MTADAFSNCHPAVNFLFFVGAIGFSVLIQHPAYLIAGAIGAAVYYLLLSGRAGWKRIAMLLPMVLMLTAVNPLFNTYGERVLFHVFGRPYTVEALLYGAAIAGVFLVMMLWFGCYNAVMTSDKFTSLFGNLIPAISLLLVMVLRMIPSFIRKAGQIMGARKSIGLGAGENSTVREKLTCGMRTLSALTDWALEGQRRDRGLHARPGLRHSQAHKLSDLPDEDAGLDASCSDAHPRGCGRSGGRHGRRGGGVYAEACHSARYRHLRAGLYCLLRLPLYPLCTTLEGGRSMAHIEIENLSFSYPSAGRPSSVRRQPGHPAGGVCGALRQKRQRQNNAAAAPEIGA